jgi:hypothetical protein
MTQRLFRVIALGVTTIDFGAHHSLIRLGAFLRSQDDGKFPPFLFQSLQSPSQFPLPENGRKEGKVLPLAPQLNESHVVLIKLSLLFISLAILLVKPLRIVQAVLNHHFRSLHSLCQSLVVHFHHLNLKEMG